MPNTRYIRGRSVSAGRFTGDDQIAPKIIVQSVAAAAPAVHLDPGDQEGPLVVKYTVGGNQKGFTVVGQRCVFD